MQKVKLLKDYLKDKKGDTVTVTERHAQILFRTGIAEKENVTKDGKSKESKTATTTKEDKASTTTKDKK